MTGNPPLLSTRIIRISGLITQYQGLSSITWESTWELSVSRLDDHAQHYELSVNGRNKENGAGLLGFKANWREFYDHSYFRDLTSNQRRLGK